MSEERDEFLKYAAEAKQKAERCDNEMRALLLSVADAYELLARVRTFTDDPEAHVLPASSLSHPSSRARQ
jgi:hypothetical protein